MNYGIVVVGFCGASRASLTALMEDGILPSLKQWSAANVRGALEYPFPLSSAAAWTTLITGRPPAEHGVFDLFRKQSPQGHHLRALTSRDLPCDAIWTLLNRDGKRTTVLDFPLTVPPARIDGHVIPGSWATRRQLKMSCHPSDLPRRLSDLAVLQVESLALDWPAEPNAEWIQSQIERETQLFKTAKFLNDHEPSDLTVLLLRTVGTILAWRGGSADPRIQQASEEYFQALDAHLLQLAGAGANLILVSEPGSSTPTGPFLVNQWLADHDYLAWTDAQGPTTLERKALDTNQLNRQAKLIDWTKTRACSPLAGSNEIHVVRRDADHPGGVPEQEYESMREELIARLLDQHAIRRVWKREELYSGPHFDLAPDLVLEPRGAIAAFDEKPEEGIFIAGGPLFELDRSIDPVSILGVVPLILYGLGMEIPADLDGRLPLKAIKATWLENNPVRLGLTGSARPAAERVLDPQAEEIVLKRLQELGYLE